MRHLITIVTIVINVLSLIALVSGVLLHSGRGGGLSDMFGGGVTSTMSSSGVAERNLNRVTIILGIVWIVVIITLGLFTRFALV